LLELKTQTNYDCYIAKSSEIAVLTVLHSSYDYLMITI